MTATAQLLTDLQALGVVLAADGDRLRFHPRSVVTGKLLARLRTCKAELLAMLRTDEGVYVDTTPSKREENNGSVDVDNVDARDGDAGQSRQPQDLAVTGSQSVVPAEWPAAAADFALLLTPDDLPRPPFRLNPWTEVRDAGKMLQWLRADVRRGPSGPRARYGALQRDLEELRRFLAKIEAPVCPRTHAGGQTHD